MLAFGLSLYSSCWLVVSLANEIQRGKRKELLSGFLSDQGAGAVKEIVQGRVLKKL